MAEPVTSARDLFERLLRTMLWVELTLAQEVLPQLLEQAGTTDLRYGFERHLLETRQHVQTIRSVLADLKAHAEPEEDPALKGLVARHGELVKRVESGRTRVLDLVHAQAGAATEHLEIAAYGALVSLAEALGEEELAITLREVLEQEAFALEQINRATTKLLAEHVESNR